MKTARLLLPAVVGLALAAGCDTLDCGAGTHREGDLCVSNVQVVCAAGTRFADGACVAEDGAGGAGGAIPGDAGRTCGAGTHAEGNTCIADDAGAGGTGGVGADQGVGGEGGMGGDGGMGGEGGMGGAGGMGGEGGMGGGEPPGCPPELELGAPPAACPEPIPGGFCVTGVAIDFSTGCAVPADAGLIVAVIDPIAVINGEDPTRGVSGLGPNGTFAVAGFGASGQLALIIDEAPQVPTDAWTRAVSGVLAGMPTPGSTYTVTGFSTPKVVTQAWSTALGLEADALEATGFLIGRVLGAQGPVADARVRGRSLPDLLACDAGQACLRFFNPTMSGFEPVGTEATTASGAFMIIGPGDRVVQDRFYVEGAEATYADLPAGVSPGSGFHTAFVPMR